MTYRIKKKWTSAKRNEYNGYIYDSKFESQHAQDLDLLLIAGEIEKWERQVNIPLIVNGYEVCKYRIDFIVYHNDGVIEYQELKGVPFPAAMLKFKLFEALYSDIPDVKITFIQMGRYKHRKLKKVKK